MKTLASSIVLALTLPALADVFILKDGTRLTADVIERTPEEYVLDVYVTKSIKEPRTIKRSDIEKIERVSESDEEFKALAKLTPAPPFLDLAGYDDRIKKLEEFLKKHAVSTAGTKAKEMVAELQAEREIVAAGGVKTQDTMLTAEERLANMIDVESQAIAAEFRQLVDNRSFIPALRKFDELEAQYAASTAHREALPLYKKLLASYHLLISRELTNFPANQRLREEAFANLSDSDQARSMVAEKTRMQRVEQLREREDEKGVTWMVVDLLDEQSIANMEAKLQQRIDEMPRIEEELAALPNTSMLYKEGWMAAGEKNAEKLEPLLDQLDAAGVSEETINRLVDRYDPTINNPPKEMMEEKKEMSEEDADTDPKTSE